MAQGRRTQEASRSRATHPTSCHGAPRHFAGWAPFGSALALGTKSLLVNDRKDDPHEEHGETEDERPHATPFCARAELRRGPRVVSTQIDVFRPAHDVGFRERICKMHPMERRERLGKSDRRERADDLGGIRGTGDFLYIFKPKRLRRGDRSDVGARPGVRPYLPLAVGEQAVVSCRWSAQFRFVVEPIAKLLAVNNEADPTGAKGDDCVRRARTPARNDARPLREDERTFAEVGLGRHRGALPSVPTDERLFAHAKDDQHVAGGRSLPVGFDRFLHIGTRKGGETTPHADAIQEALIEVLPARIGGRGWQRAVLSGLEDPNIPFRIDGIPSGIHRVGGWRVKAFFRATHSSPQASIPVEGGSTDVASERTAKPLGSPLEPISIWK